MWENEIVVLLTSLKKRILSGKEKAQFRKISEDEAIPVYVKAYFQKLYEGYLSQEIPFKIQSTKHFVFSDEEIVRFQERLKDVLKEATFFPADEVENVLRDAIYLRLDYFVKPVDTMRRLLFASSQEVEVSYIEKILSPLQKDLPYAANVINACNDFGKTKLNTDDYAKVINNTLHQLMEEDPIPKILQDFSALTDFMSETKGEQINKIDGSMLHEFLVDRNTWGFRRALEVEMKLGKQEFSSSDLEMTLKRYLELKEEFKRSLSEKPEEKPVPAVAEVAQQGEVETIALNDLENDVLPEEIEIDEIVDSEEIVELEETAIIEEKVLQTEQPDTPKSIEPTAWEFDEAETKEGENEEVPQIEEVIMDQDESIQVDELIEIEKEDASQEKESLNIQGKEAKRETEKPAEKPDEEAQTKKKQKQMRIIRRDQEEEVEEKAISGNELLKESVLNTDIQGLRSYIDDKTEKVFIKKLFGGDNAAYGRLLDKLDEAESWRVAKILIDNELFKRDVDPFSREAIKLVDLVYTRYYPEEGVGGKK